jgi:hypothetical protein
MMVCAHGLDVMLIGAPENRTRTKCRFLWPATEVSTRNVLSNFTRRDRDHENVPNNGLSRSDTGWAL